MKNFIISILALILTTVYSYAYNPKVYIEVNNNRLYEGEKLKVTIVAKADENSTISLPNLKNINGFEFESNSKIIKRKRVDDNTAQVYIEEKKSYIIKPNRSFNIERFKVFINNKAHVTPTKHISIITKKSLKSSDSNFSFEMKTDKKEVVTKEPFIITILFTQPIDSKITQIDLLQPKFSEFESKQIGTGRIVKKGKNLARELKYELIAKKSGNFTIEPASIKYKLEPTSLSNSTFSFLPKSNNYKTLKTNSISIKVNTLPKGVDIIGNYKINSKFSKNQKFYQEEPIKYTITLKGYGDLKNFNLAKPEIKNVTVYVNNPKIMHSLKNDKVYSTFTKEYTFIANKDFTIPKVKIISYNPRTKKVTSLSTKEQLINLTQKRNITAILNNEKPTDNTKTETTYSIDNIDKKVFNNNVFFDVDFYKSKYVKGNRVYKYILTFILGVILGVISTIYIPILYKLLTNKKDFNTSLFNSYQEALNILYPYTQEKEEIEIMVKDLYEVTSGNEDIKINNKKLIRLVKEVLRKE